MLILPAPVYPMHEEFQAPAGKAGLSLREFAQLLKMNRNSISNYARIGSVPAHLAVIAALLGEMADGRSIFAPLAKLDIEEKTARRWYQRPVWRFRARPICSTATESSTDCKQPARRAHHITPDKTGDRNARLRLAGRYPAAEKPFDPQPSPVPTPPHRQPWQMPASACSPCRRQSMRNCRRSSISAANRHRHWTAWPTTADPQRRQRLAAVSQFNHDRLVRYAHASQQRDPGRGGSDTPGTNTRRQPQGWRLPLPGCRSPLQRRARALPKRQPQIKCQTAL